MNYRTKDGRSLTRKPDQFFWRGQYFHGLVDVPRNVIFDDPEDSFATVVGIKPDGQALPAEEVMNDKQTPTISI